MDKEKLSKKELFYRDNVFNSGSLMYVPQGSEMLLNIGQNVVMVEFKCDEKGEWSSTSCVVTLDEIKDYEAIDMTYKLTYHQEGKEKVEVQVIPEMMTIDYIKLGKNEFKRFLPLSLHYKCMEDSMAFSRLINLYKDQGIKTMNPESLSQIGASKEKKNTLNYTHNIQCIVEDEGSFGAFKVVDIKVRKKGSVYYLMIYDKSKNLYNAELEEGDEDIDLYAPNQEFIGIAKIIDLGNL